VDNQVSRREFTEDDQYLLSALADYAAISMENATLYDELRKSLDDLRRSQQELIQSSKLAALGRLTASLAHEINNPLQAIRSCVSLLAKRPLDEGKREEYLGIADKELVRLIQMVDRMLDFYRPSIESRGPTDVNALLEDTLTLASKQLQHSDIKVTRELAADLPPVEAVASYLKQVFINLILNAVEAMPDGGELAVRTSLDEETAEMLIVFSDTGVGIASDSLPLIFEPFYTTKDSGTGLGLSISHSIVEQHGGSIEVDNTGGVGTTLTVRLPLRGQGDV
jgi:two-component system NtrC family sensor kinase